VALRLLVYFDIVKVSILFEITREKSNKMQAFNFISELRGSTSIFEKRARHILTKSVISIVLLYTKQVHRAQVDT
jgi:hypothetical protein